MLPSIRRRKQEVHQDMKRKGASANAYVPSDANIGDR